MRFFFVVEQIANTKIDMLSFREDVAVSIAARVAEVNVEAIGAGVHVSKRSFFCAVDGDLGRRPRAAQASLHGDGAVDAVGADDEIGNELFARSGSEADASLRRPACAKR